MLGMIDHSLDTTKRAYGSVMDFAIIPFVYSIWFDTHLFDEMNWFSYSYIALSILSFAAKELSARYKLANPHLSEEEHAAIVKIVDSVFAGIGGVSEMVFPALVLDVIYKIKNIFSAKALQIIHPTFVGVAGTYGIYKGLQHFGYFKCLDKKDTPTPILESSESSAMVWKRIEAGTPVIPSVLHSSVSQEEPTIQVGEDRVSVHYESP